MDLVADIKSHINVEDLVSSYVQLKRVGKNFKGLCPFHTEKSPSFYVSAEKQLAYCFGCQQGGDIFQFFQLIEGVDFSEALKMLAERAGLDYAQYRSTMQKMPSKNEKQILLDAHEKATAFFETQLWETSAGATALEYIRGRGLSDETIRRFRIGFAPDSFDALYTFLSHENISKTSLIESGLVISKDTSGDRVYDRFRLRLMFPIKNAQGQIVAFGGRALKKDMEPKYLNSPETILY
ncbi:MAG: DNA primase, partial [Patescibacteria group bacterium]